MSQIRVNQLSSYGEIEFYDDESFWLNMFPTLITVYLLAMFSVFVGTSWSGYVRYLLWKNKSSKRANKSLTDQPGQVLVTTSSKKPKEEEEAFIKLSACKVLYLVCTMSTSLLLLYFFRKYLVYFILFMFVMGSAYSLFFIMVTLTTLVVPQAHAKFFIVPPFLWVKSMKIRYGHLVLYLIAQAASLVWLIYRDADWSWMLQDILGVAFCIVMLRMTRLPSFKICATFLCFLFVYDIFFVFITPLFTSKGQSIMVEVAIGEGSQDERQIVLPGCDRSTENEVMPMLLRVPARLLQAAECSDRFSMLGFGDIIAPGLLISYCMSYDLIRKVPYHLYFVSAFICYGLGMVMTYVGKTFPVFT